jgi:hypothetical protein
VTGVSGLSVHVPVRFHMYIPEVVGIPFEIPIAISFAVLG